MKISKKSLSTFGVVVGILSLSGVAYAFTSTDFNTRAQAWTTATCTQALINSRNNLSNNQKATICYNFLRANEQQNTLNGHQLSIDDLLSRAAVPGPKGDKGDTGEQGLVGPKGDTGEQGIQGPEGLSTRVKLYDANNTILGIEPTSQLTGFSSGGQQFFNTTIERRVTIDQRGRIDTDTVSYENRDCTGTPLYSTRDSSPVPSAAYMGVLNSGGIKFYTAEDNAIPSYMVINSYRATNGVDCSNSTSGGNTIRLTEVTLPFSYPIAMPLSLKYE